MAVIREQFSEPESICLLIRDSQWTTPPAKFIYWREKDLQSADVDFPAISEVSADQRRKLDPPAGAPNGRLRKAVAITAGAIALAILIGALLKYERVHATAFPKVTSAEPASILELAATQEGNAVRLTWNGHSADIRNAQSGVLLVNDGQRQKEIPLEAAQLGLASFWYFPLSDKLRFRLDVMREDGGRVEQTVGLSLLKPEPPLNTGKQVTGRSEDRRRARSR